MDGSPTVPVGTADEEGNYPIECNAFGQGAPAGKYKALIQLRGREDGKVQRTAGANPRKKPCHKVVADRSDEAPGFVHGRHMNAGSMVFHVEVKPEKNDVEPLDVSS